MTRRAVNHDVGIYPFGEACPSRAVFDLAVVRREIEIIRSDLYCVDAALAFTFVTPRYPYKQDPSFGRLLLEK